MTILGSAIPLEKVLGPRVNSWDPTMQAVL